MEKRQDKSNELNILSDNTTIQRRFIMDRFDRNNISEKEKDDFLKELEETHSKQLLDILQKYE